MGAQNLVVEKKREMGAQIFTVGDKWEAEEQHFCLTSGDWKPLKSLHLKILYFTVWSKFSNKQILLR